jgi:hypothetical protein
MIRVIVALIFVLPVVAVCCAVFLSQRGVPAATIRRWWLTSTGVYLFNLPLILLGLPIVAIALRFATRDKTAARPYTVYPQYGSWLPVRLPVWARPWDNPTDGLLGDKRGWWANHCQTRFGHPSTAALCMWLWATIRNPANYWSRITTGVDVSRCTIAMLAGSSRRADETENGWHFLEATRDDGRKYHLFQVAIKYPFSATHGFYCRFGWKVELDEPVGPDVPLQERMRASVYKVSIWKDLA